MPPHGRDGEAEGENQKVHSADPLGSHLCDPSLSIYHTHHLASPPMFPPSSIMLASASILAKVSSSCGVKGGFRACRKLTTAPPVINKAPPMATKVFVICFKALEFKS